MGKLLVECYNKKIGLKRIANAVYKTLCQTDDILVELGFVSEQEIKEYNKNTRGVDKVTDVLSYPTLDGICGKVLKASDYPLDIQDGKIFLGSIILCKEKIAQQAMEIGHSEKQETQYLIVHGLMHLFGYDHIDEKDKILMREKEKSALAELGIFE